MGKDEESVDNDHDSKMKAKPRKYAIIKQGNVNV